MKNTINKFATAVLVMSVLAVFSATIIASGNDVDAKKSKKDIVSIALEAGNFNTLATALTEAGLVETLKGEGPFTVFAPTDEAFAKLPEGTVEALLKDKEALTNILLYHVVSGKVMSSDVVKLDKATTVSKNDVMINVIDGNVFINQSKVTTADVKASNGVIHIIDNVLIPESK